MEHIPQYLVLKDPIDLLRKAISVYAKNWRAFSVIALIPIIFSFGIVDVSQFDMNSISTFILLFITSIFTVLFVVLSIVSMSATMRAFSLAFKDKSIDIANVYIVGLKKILGLIFILLISSITLIGGSIFFLVPGIIINVFLTFATFIYINEKVGPIQAIYDSFSLVFKRGWRTFMRVLFITVVSIGAITFMDLSIEGFKMFTISLGDFSFFYIYPLLDVISVILLNAIVVPVTVGYMSALYFDLKDSEPNHGKEQKVRLELTAQLFFALGIVALVAYIFVTKF